MSAAVSNSGASSTTGYNRFLLPVAGLGGLLYGVDVGIIAGALPYLEATSGLSGNQPSVMVAALLFGSVISTFFTGMLADWMGRKKLMFLSGLRFVISIPIIALAHGYGPLLLGLEREDGLRSRYERLWLRKPPLPRFVTSSGL